MSFAGSGVSSTPYEDGSKNNLFDYNHYIHSATDNLFYWGASNVNWTAWRTTIAVPQDAHGDLT